MSEYKAYGSWKVSTEGDEEGRTTRQLGTYEGYVDDIALHLADKSYYKLTFSLNNETSNADLHDEFPALKKAYEDYLILLSLCGSRRYPPTRDHVYISFGIDSGTWDIVSDVRKRYFQDLLKNRNISVEDGKFYASVLLVKEKYNG